jgi:hypothetical protein
MQTKGFRAVLAVVALAAAGCGNSPINVAGHSFNVESAEMMQMYGLPYVYLTDIPDFCSRMRSLYSNPAGCNVTATSNTAPFGSLYGSIFAIGAYGASDGARLSILPPTGTTATTITSGSAVSFVTTGLTTTTIQAISGLVNIESYRNADHIAGNYDVTLSDGEHEQGHFAAKYCNAMEFVGFAAQNTRTCSESYVGDQYFRDCSCGSRSVSASCTRSDVNSTWTCSCSNSSSTCTMSHAPTAGSDTGTCCSLQL